MKEKRVKSRRNPERGFSLIELMFAVAVLAIAVLGALAMIVIGIGRNGSNRMDTAATNVAQTVLENIAGVPATTAAPIDPGAPPPPPVLNNPVLTISDCTGNNYPINTAPGGAGVYPNDQTGAGDIDFSQPTVDGYHMNYTVCNNGVQTVYDVRWNVQQLPPPNGWGKLITVAAREPMAVQKGTLYYLPPVTLRTVVI